MSLAYEEQTNLRVPIDPKIQRPSIRCFFSMLSQTQTQTLSQMRSNRLLSRLSTSPRGSTTIFDLPHMCARAGHARAEPDDRQQQQHGAAAPMLTLERAVGHAALGSDSELRSTGTFAAEVFPDLPLATTWANLVKVLTTWPPSSSAGSSEAATAGEEDCTVSPGSMKVTTVAVNVSNLMRSAVYFPIFIVRSFGP